MTQPQPSGNGNTGGEKVDASASKGKQEEEPAPNKPDLDGKKSKEDEAAAAAAAAAPKEGTTPTTNLGSSLLGDSNEEEPSKANVAAEKVLSVSANLAKLLPSGAVLVFQTLSASFTNQGSCNAANKWLSGALVAFLTAACIFLTFTDSIYYGKEKKTYYGVALPQRLKIFGLTTKQERPVLKDLGRELKDRRLKTLDWAHAFFTAIVFLSIAMGDVGLQKCFFPNLDDDNMKNVKELLRNAPLGLALLSSFVFMIFPTTRRGVGFDNRDPHDKETDGPNKNKDAANRPKNTPAGDIENGNRANPPTPSK